jgi:hypothetical protein
MLYNIFEKIGYIKKITFLCRNSGQYRTVHHETKQDKDQDSNKEYFYDIGIRPK